MPKFSEEMDDKIIALIERGDRNADISRALGVYRGAVAKRRKEHEKRKRVQEQVETEKEMSIQQEPPLDQQKYTRVHTDGLPLSESARSKLNQIHTLLGSNTLDAMIETVYSDYVAADKYRLKYMDEFPGAEAPKTFAGIIAEEQGYAADLKHDLDIYMEGYKEDRELKEELKAEAERQFEEGYLKGKNEHALLVPCVRCGTPITLKPGNESHGLIVDFLREHRIAHEDCIPRFKRIFA